MGQGSPRLLLMNKPLKKVLITVVKEGICRLVFLVCLYFSPLTDLFYPPPLSVMQLSFASYPHHQHWQIFVFEDYGRLIITRRSDMEDIGDLFGERVTGRSS